MLQTSNSLTPETKMAEQSGRRRVLLVDDYAGVRTTMSEILSQHRFEVVTAATVPDALRFCCTEQFDVLLCDLHMPRPGDGFIVVGAMRHCHPEALTILYSAYPAMGAAMSDILLQADEVLVKPLIVADLISLIDRRLGEGSQDPRIIPGDAAESVATVLRREAAPTIAEWLERVKENGELAKLPLSDADRTAHLPQLFADLINRLQRPQPLEASTSNAGPARLHGETRRRQGYTAALIVEESRLFQVSIFRTLQANLHILDFSHLLVGVMTIADEVDAHLKQTMDSYIGGGKDPQTAAEAA